MAGYYLANGCLMDVFQVAVFMDVETAPLRKSWGAVHGCWFAADGQRCRWLRLSMAFPLRFPSMAVAQMIWLWAKQLTINDLKRIISNNKRENNGNLCNHMVVGQY